MMKKLKFIYLLSILLAFGMMSCGDNDPTPADEEETPVDIEDPNAITKGLTFQNGTATLVEEDFPEPSADASAPQLPEPYDEGVVGIAGGNLVLDLYTQNGSTVKGVYLQVNGADQYYDIVLNEANNNIGRFSNNRKNSARNQRQAKKQETNDLVLTLPDGLPSGNFCITYAVYDDENRVSNHVKICIEAKSKGGENSNFLTANTWALEMEYYKEIYEGETYGDTIIVGHVYIDSRTDSYTCEGDGGQWTEVKWIEEYTLNYVHFKFSKDGSIIVKEDYSDEDGNIENICETGKVELLSDDSVDQANGSWSYDDAKKELTIILQYTENSIATPADGGEPIVTEEIEIDYEVYQVSQENGKLILTQEETGEWGSSSETKIFAPKK